MKTNKPLPAFKETMEEMGAKRLTLQQVIKLGYTPAENYGTLKIVMDQDHRGDVPTDLSL